MTKSKRPTIPLIYWIEGILHAEPMTPKDVALLLGRPGGVASTVKFLRDEGRVRIHDWRRQPKNGLPLPIYGPADGQPDAAPTLYGIKEIKARYERRWRNAPFPIKRRPKSHAEYSRISRARKKLRVPSVFDWRGPLKPREKASAP